MNRAVYAGSFDPPTNGHLWMIRTAQQLFGELIVAVGENPDKQCTYSIEERVEMLTALAQEFNNVRVMSMKNIFLVEFAQQMQADFIVRGIRTASDYEFERSMRHINADSHPEIATIFLMPPREYTEISSTMVKGLIGPKNWQNIIKRYLPDAVYQRMVQKYDNQGD